MANLRDESASESSFTTTSSTGRVWSAWISGNASDWSKEKKERQAGLHLDLEAALPERRRRREELPEIETQPPTGRARELTPTEAITEAGLTVAVDHLYEDREDGRERAHEVWRWMIVFAVVGAVLVSLGAVLWLFGIVKAAGVVAIEGVVSGGGGFGMFWKLYRGEKTSLENIRRDLQFFDSRRLELILSTQISDTEERDRRIGKLMDELARVRPASDSDPDE